MPQASFFFELIVVLSLPCCWKWKLPALICSTFTLLILAFFLWDKIDSPFWQAGYLLALALGLLITTLGLQETESEIVEEEPTDLSHTEDPEPISLYDPLREAQLKWESERNYMNLKLIELKREVANKNERIIALNEALEIQKPSVDSKEVESQIKQQESANCDSQNKHLEATKSNDRPQAENDLNDLLEIKSLYYQLKKQFELKNEVLSTTRAELFHLEVKYLALQREEEERLRVPPDNHHLINSLLELEEECKMQEVEIEQLHSLLTLLFNAPMSVKKRQSARKLLKIQT